MIRRRSILTLSLLVLVAAFSATAADVPDAAKAGVKAPDLKKLDAAEEVEGAGKKPAPKGKPGAVKASPLKPGAAKPAAAKPDPIMALPDWVTPLPGFQPGPGGRKWTEDDVEKWEINGTAPGEPREVAENWVKAAKEHFRDVTTNEAASLRRTGLRPGRSPPPPSTSKRSSSSTRWNSRSSRAKAAKRAL